MAKILVLLKKVFTITFASFILKPAIVVLRFLFYKVAVKIYGLYLSLSRKLGLKRSKTDSFSFVFNQKLIHITVIAVTLILVFTNLTTDTKAQSINEASGKTILSSLITSEFGTLDEQQIVEETFDQEQTISPTQQKYLDSLSTVKSQPIPEVNPADSAADVFGSDVARVNGSLVNSGISSTNITKQTRKEIITYAVEPGDTISTIAQKFEIGVNTILWANNLSAYSVIRPGDNLKILPMSGVLHDVASGESLKSLASKYDVDQAAIAQANNLSENSSIRIGQQLIIPGGRKGSYTEEKSQSYSGIALLKDLIKTKKAAPEVSDSSDSEDDSEEQAPPSSGNKMHWPTTGHRITQYFSWRHFAIDVADPIGTPLFAADSGVVEKAGWGTGYGNQILINHGGGKQTRYAHLSKFLVKTGDTVTKGQTIGLMGSTGWSTGPHVHFEVIINGVKYNPLNYVR